MTETHEQLVMKNLMCINLKLMEEVRGLKRLNEQQYKLIATQERTIKDISQREAVKQSFSDDQLPSISETGRTVFPTNNEKEKRLIERCEVAEKRANALQYQVQELEAKLHRLDSVLREKTDQFALASTNFIAELAKRDARTHGFENIARKICLIADSVEALTKDGKSANDLSQKQEGHVETIKTIAEKKSDKKSGAELSKNPVDETTSSSSLTTYTPGMLATPQYLFAVPEIDRPPLSQFAKSWKCRGLMYSAELATATFNRLITLFVQGKDIFIGKNRVNVHNVKAKNGLVFIAPNRVECRDNGKVVVHYVFFPDTLLIFYPKSVDNVVRFYSPA